MVSALLKQRLLPALGVSLLTTSVVVAISDRAQAFNFGSSGDYGCQVGPTSVSPCSLQNLLNASGYSNVTTSAPSGIGFFNTTGITGLSGNILFALAGNAPITTVGLFNVNNPSVTQIISSRAINTPALSVNGQNLLNIPLNISLIPGLQNTTVGFFLTTPLGQTFFSGGSQTSPATTNFLSYRLPTIDERPPQWIIAWDDSLYGTGDTDYNDYVALIQFNRAASVPEPGTLGGLMAIGGLLAFVGRRRQARVD